MLAKDVVCFLYENNKGCFCISELVDAIENTEYYLNNDKIELIKQITETIEDTEDVDTLKKGLFLIDHVTAYETIKKEYDYNKAVMDKIKAYIHANPLEKIDIDTYNTLNVIYECYHEDEDLYNFVSGNNTNEYFIEEEDAENCLYNNYDLILNSFLYFNYDYEDIKKMSATNVDCLVRCYVFENILLIALADIYKKDLL